MSIRRLLLCIAAAAISMAGFSQNLHPWKGVSVETVKSYTDLHKDVLPLHYSLLKMDPLQVSQVQQQANGSVITKQSVQSAVKFDLPLPDGHTISTAMFKTALLSDELQQANPGIQTYQLVNPQTNNIAARLTITSAGISGILFTENGTAYISPLGAAFPDVHMIYYTKDIVASAPVSCGLASSIATLQPMSALAGDCQKRTYRLAVAATGEYTTWAGSQANALAYITTSINNISAIYERDANVHFTLVTNNSILFTNAGTDPYATVSFPTGTTLSTNHTTLNTNIGSANYDLGIVFNYGWNGGLASLGVVCNNSFKGQGSAGLDFGLGANATPGPQGPIFDQTAAHEIAHEFSATHTHSATNGACGPPNISAITAYETGGGSTIMAYAGSCTGNSYQNYSDLYFHAGSIAQIQSYITGGSGSCAAVTSSGNNAPSISTPAGSYTIPVSTPFTLSSTGSDADANTLKYTWDQMDAGFTSSAPPLATAVSGPNFRSYPPSLNSNRTFPPLANIVANTATPYEVLSSVTRTMNFRVTVRDDAAGGGCTAEANVAVTTDASAGPFTVTSHSTATSLVANGSNTTNITWNVANTTSAPVSCGAVDILFSVDGGVSFPYTLLSNTPNDGNQTIAVPNLATYSGRIKVQAHNNIFFNINAADITITSGCAASGTTFTPATSVSGAAGSALLDLTLSPLYGSIVAPSGQIVSTDPVTSLSFNNLTAGNCMNSGNAFKYKTYKFTVNLQGTYTISRTSAPGGLIINLYNNDFDPSNPCANFINSNGTFNGATVNITSSLTATLTPGKYYTLAIGTFDTGVPALPANFTVSVSGVAGGNLYTGPANPGAGFAYTYVIVNNSTGFIKAIDAGSDLSNSSSYPTGTYTIYGLSYSNSIAPAVLNTYVGGAFSTLSNDLLNNPATLCGNLSQNTMAATVNASLPVSLLPLKVYKTGTHAALLKWATASEQNNDYFEVQRSADGTSFNSILGRINGKDNSSVQVDYNFPDASPEPGMNYYRLKQVDKDGKYIFSNVVRANFTGKNASVTTWPNPAAATLHVDYYTETAGKVKWMVADSKGAVVKQSVFSAQSGRNQQQLNVSGLAAGTYILRTVSDTEVLITKFIKE